MRHWSQVTEQDEMAELRALTRLRCLEAVREGIPRASFLAQIIRFLSETKALEDPPQRANVRGEDLPFPATRKAATSEALPFPPQSAAESPKLPARGEIEPLEAHVTPQHRRPLGNLYDP